MQNREFEKNVQQKMGELKFTPADALWDKVEASLPEQKKRHRWLIFILLFGVLAIGSIVLWNKFNNNHLISSDNNLIAKEVTLQNPVAQKMEANKKQIAKDNATKKNEELIGASTIISKNNKIFTASSLKVKIKNAAKDQLSNTAEENLVTKDYKPLKTTGLIKITIKTPVESIVVNEKLSDILVAGEDESKIKNIAIIDTTVLINDSLIVKAEEIKVDSLIAQKKDTIKINELYTKQKNSINVKWAYGVDIAAGVSTVKNNLFSSSPVFFDANQIYISGPPNPQVRLVPNNPSKGAAFSLGFYMERAVNEKWKFSTGLNYLYQYNSILVGNRVDSALNVRLDVFKSFSTNNYYTTGNSIAYKNKFHLIEIPLLFQYQFSKKSPIYLKTGFTVAYLLKSNALVYNNNSAAYITDKSIFNKALLSTNIGAGINLAKKSKLPFSIGYQFKYSIGSVTKKEFGKQHFVNSLLYLKIPFKK